MECTNEYAHKDIIMGALFKIASFSIRIAADLSLHITKRVQHKIEKAYAQKQQRKQRCYDHIHDD